MDSYPLHGLCPPGSSVHWSLQARTLEWVAISFSRDSSWPRNWTLVSCIAGRFFTIWATRKALYPLNLKGNPGICILSRKPRIEKDWVDKEAQFSRSVMSDSLRSHGLQHARPPCPSPTPGVYSDLCPLTWWCHPTSHPLLFPSPPTFNLSQHQGLLKSVYSSHQMAKGLEFQLQHQSFQWTLRTDLLLNGLVGSPCSPRDSPVPLGFP